jgi:hypothetical protein
VSGLALAAWIALAFGAGAYYATGSAGWFSTANLALGALALAAEALRALARARGAAAPGFRGVALRGLVGVLAVVAAGVGLERLASASKLQFDWTLERRFEISPAVRDAIAELAARGGVDATLYRDPFDPRIRSTRLLLASLAAAGPLRVREKLLDESPEDADRFAIDSSNTVVLELEGRSETVQRPTEGTLFEALYRLRGDRRGALYVASGAGEGELEREDGAGYSGLARALQTEGYRLHQFVPAAATEIPEDASALLVLAPRRPWLPGALAALERYLERGGRLVAFLEPGAESGIEQVLARWGFDSPDAPVIDAASAALPGELPGVNPLAFHYAAHPVTRGLDRGRMTLFHGARSFRVRKPRVEDQVGGIVMASERAWLSADTAAAARSAPPVPPAGRLETPPALAAAGSYRRGERETRIVAFGDAELASNHYLRALYNLDVVMNAVHWAAQQEPAITIRPKAAVSGRLQLPLPVPDTLTMFQGVGLLLPELLLLAAAFAWDRSRSA